MFRIKDAKVSLKFYTEILGMELGESDTESIDVGTEPYC
jgi:catechol 2,3-dioxygenase-like lactoylglutathione lyase family enzyme